MYNLITDLPAHRTVADVSPGKVHITEYELHGDVWCRCGTVHLTMEEFEKVAKIMMR